VWLPVDAARIYGLLERFTRSALGQTWPEGRVPLVLHPQPPAGHRRLRDRYGSAIWSDVSVTPTASFRTVVAWRGHSQPVALKLSMSARVGGISRALPEFHIAGAIILSQVMDFIPLADRRRFGFDWFSEPAGLVDVESGCGWLLRLLPSMMHGSAGGDLMPAFSLIAPRDDRPPPIVDLIRASNMKPETFVIEQVLRPYVRTLAYLMFEQGLHLEAHLQNVLFEMAGESLTGKVILRDLSDGTVSIALRLARQRPFPIVTRSAPTRSAPFPLGSAAADHMANDRRPWLMRAQDTVEGYGLRQLVRHMNASLEQCFVRYDARRVARAYFGLWQQQATERLGVKPLIVGRAGGLATDEAIAYFLRNVDWRSLGASGPVRLPARIQAVPTGQPTRRRAGAAYRRVECPWGDLFLEDNRPAFFRPAF